MQTTRRLSGGSAFVAAAVFGILLGAGILSWAQNVTVQGNATFNGTTTVSGTLDTGSIYMTCTGGDWTDCSCPAGMYIKTGGCYASTSPYYFQQNSPLAGSLTTWRCGGYNTTKTIYLICTRAH